MGRSRGAATRRRSAFLLRQSTLFPRHFAERLPRLAAARGRRTLAQRTLLLEGACALGGQAGARLANRNGLHTSRATLLRLIAQAPVPPVGSPRVLGVDDWSLRRSKT
jgi:hypothetical protein